MTRPLLIITDFPSSAYPTSRAGAITSISPEVARLWKLEGRTHPSSFTLTPQKRECDRRKGEPRGILKALNWVREFIVRTYQIPRKDHVYTALSVKVFQKNFVITLPNTVVCKNRLIIKHLTPNVGFSVYCLLQTGIQLVIRR